MLWHAGSMAVDTKVLMERYVRASFPQRAGAVLVDCLLFSVLVAMPATLISWWFGPPAFTTCTIVGSSESCSITPEALRYTRTVFYMLASVFVLVYAYSTVRGASIGKRATEILVIDVETGDTVGYGRALVRTLLSIVSFALFGLGFFFAFTNEQRRTLHDVLTKTRVISP